MCHFLPVRPTFLRHIKQRFFLGFGGSGALNSSLPAVEGWEAENVGWRNTGDTQEKYANQSSSSVINLHRWHTWVAAVSATLSVSQCHVLELLVHSREATPLHCWPVKSSATFFKFAGREGASWIWGWSCISVSKKPLEYVKGGGENIRFRYV